MILPSPPSGWWSSSPAGPTDRVQFQVQGHTYAELRQRATEVLAELMSDLGTDAPPLELELELEINPDDEIFELGQVGPRRWQADVSVTIRRPEAEAARPD